MLIKYSVIWDIVTDIKTIMKFDEVKLIGPSLSTWNIWKTLNLVICTLNDCNNIQVIQMPWWNYLNCYVPPVVVFLFIFKGWNSISLLTSIARNNHEFFVADSHLYNYIGR